MISGVFTGTIFDVMYVPSLCTTLYGVYLVCLREGVSGEATGSEVGDDLGDRERCHGVRVQWREQ